MLTNVRGINLAQYFVVNYHQCNLYCFLSLTKYVILMIALVLHFNCINLRYRQSYENITVSLVLVSHSGKCSSLTLLSAFLNQVLSVTSHVRIYQHSSSYTLDALSTLVLFQWFHFNHDSEATGFSCIPIWLVTIELRKASSE